MFNEFTSIQWNIKDSKRPCMLPVIFTEKYSSPLTFCLDFDEMFVLPFWLKPNKYLGTKGAMHFFLLEECEVGLLDDESENGPWNPLSTERNLLPLLA